MKNQLRLSITFILLVSAPLTLSAGLFKKKAKQPTFIYGIEKSMYDSMNEGQKKGVMELYSTTEKQGTEIKELYQKMAALEDEYKKQQKLASKCEELKATIEAQEKALNGYLTISEDLLAARAKEKNYEEREKREKFYPKIAAVRRSFNSTTVELDNDTLIEISPFEKEKIDTWMNGQTIELTKGDGLVYTLHLQNLDTENGVAAKIKEIKEKPAP